MNGRPLTEPGRHRFPGRHRSPGTLALSPSPVSRTRLYTCQHVLRTRNDVASASAQGFGEPRCQTHRTVSAISVREKRCLPGKSRKGTREGGGVSPRREPQGAATASPPATCASCPLPPLRVFTSSSPWTRGQANTLPASGLGLIRMRTLRAGARLARAARGWTPQAGGLQGERVSDDHSVPHRHDPACVPAPRKRPGRWQEAGSGGSG